MCICVETIIGMAVGGVVVITLLIVIAYLLIQKHYVSNDEYMNLIIVNHRDIREDPKGPKQPLFMNKQVILISPTTYIITGLYIFIIERKK